MAVLVSAAHGQNVVKTSWDWGTEEWVFVVAAVVAFVALVGSRWMLAAKTPGADRTGGWRTQLAVWEHDRLDGVAKGLAGGAVGFLTSLLVAAISKDGLNPNLTWWDLLGCLLGIVGCLVFAVLFTRDARTYGLELEDMS